jgi:cyclin-dependent kinase regulatory subunit CKS1
MTDAASKRKYIEYSERYIANGYLYRQVYLTASIVEKMDPYQKTFSETECEALGIKQSPGWENYGRYPPQPDILLFRRPVDDDTTSDSTPLLPLDTTANSQSSSLGCMSVGSFEKEPKFDLVH